MPESCRTTTATGLQGSIQPRKTSSADRKNGRSALRFGQGYQPEARSMPVRMNILLEALEKSGKEIEAAIHYRIAEELRKKRNNFLILRSYEVKSS